MPRNHVKPDAIQIITNHYRRISMPKNKVVLIDIIWASGQFLTEPFPDDYEQWSNEKLDDFIDDHKWEPFEDYDPSFIWGLNRLNILHIV